ncbi:MAG: recombination regulator RecX [Aquabacterium sp.]
MAAPEDDAGAARSRRPGLSLKGRALKYLAAREHSRVELRRKLGPYAETPEEVERVLDELESRRFLSAERFAESVAHRRGARYGASRVQAELAQHQLPPDVVRDAVQTLRDSEFDRAWALWARRYGAIPTEAAERARQSRFLASRGFSGDIIRRILRGETPELPAEE